MQLEQAVSILDSLAAGVDPASGAAISAEALQSTDVASALSLAAKTLRGKAAQPNAAGARWTDEEDAVLCREFDAALSIAEIARQHDRTRGAITSRLVRLGKIDASAVKVRER